MPTVSAIIPAFNGVSRYLEQAMGSVLAQTFHDVELIVVDDASTDDTGRLVLGFQQARYVRRAENGGQAAARNDGARLARGEYLAFLDQDDLWEPTFLEETLATLRTNPNAAVVHCDGYQVNEHNAILYYDHAMMNLFSITQVLRGGHDVATSGALFRRTCFDAVGGYDDQLSIWEDIDLAITASMPETPRAISPRSEPCWDGSGSLRNTVRSARRDRPKAVRLCATGPIITETLVSTIFAKATLRKHAERSGTRCETIPSTTRQS